MLVENVNASNESSMTLFHQTKQKIQNIQRTIDSLLEGDFPLESGKNALRGLKSIFEDLSRKLDRAKNLADQKLVRESSNNINLKIYQCLPILGFIIRSTNVRNAFELLDPLQHLADCALKGTPELLISSEWDYVPFAYPQSLEDLATFVLIGLPASEANNALLTPLTGHELGHAVWRNRGLEGAAVTTLQFHISNFYDEAKASGVFQNYFPDYDEADIIRRELFLDALAESLDVATFQAEEIFCDLFGYALFGEAYLYAFSYMLAPNPGKPTASKYPSYTTRLSALRKIASSEAVILPDDQTLNFIAEIEGPDSSRKFILRGAKEGVSKIIDALWKNIIQIVSEGNIRRPVDSNSATHLNELQNGIPTHEPLCLGDIIQAGWRRYNELQDAGLDEPSLLAKVSTLCELLFKSMEVLEFRRRTSGA